MQSGEQSPQQPALDGRTPLGEHVLFVHAHPDDETLATGAAIAHVAAAGVASVLTLTLGERGEVRPEVRAAAHDVLAAGGVAALRSLELDRALLALGATRVEPVRRFADSGMAWASAPVLSAGAAADPGADRSAVARAVAVPAPEVGDDALTRQRPSDVEAIVLDVVDRLRPSAIVTYDEHGGYGHPDHEAVHRAAAAAGAVAGIPVYVRVDRPAEVAIDAAPVADRIRAALDAHASQLRREGDEVVHVGGQRERIATVEHYRRLRGESRPGWGTTIVIGLVALVIGTVGTFTHRAVEPWGLVLALVAAAGIIVGPRMLGSRPAAIAAAVGVLAPIAFVALDPFRTASLAGLVAADLLGWLWVLVPAAAAFVALLWPSDAGVQRIRDAARG